MVFKSRSISPGFIPISRIKPAKDESTVGTVPIRSVLQPRITRIPGAEKREIQRRWSAHLQSIHLNLPFGYYVLSFAILSICSYKAFCRKMRSLLLQPASALPACRSALYRRSLNRWRSHPEIQLSAEPSFP